MILLARIADRGPMTAAALAAGLLLAALWLPALMVSGGAAGLVLFASMFSMLCLIASAAVVAFVALRHGEVSALQVVGGCLLLMVVVSLALYGTAVHIPLIATVFWLPAIVAAFVLARSVKLNYAVLTIVACGVLSVVVLGLVMGDTTAFWRSQFGDMGAATTMSNANGGAALLTEAQREEFITAMANLMTGAMGVSVMSVALGALFLARAWQAGLVNPGGFQKEFHALSLGRNAALFCVLVIALSIGMGGQVPGAIATVVIFAFFIQGLAVAHALVKQRGMHRFWLHGIYVLLMLPHTLLLLAALGLADNMFSLRRPKEQ
ncbi:MAG: DUF2232 domain-containing protein [Granulosicoccus sp.]